jgi:tripartite motif-containing protein 71
MGLALSRLRGAGRLKTALLCSLLALVMILTRAADARADGCPGSGTASCPYASAQVIGQRAEGVLRFPEAVAVDTQGNVYVADQLGYVVQEFTASGQFEAEWGSWGGGHGQFGPIGGLATDAAGNVYVVDSSRDRIEKFTADGAFIGSWGHKGSALGDFEFGSSENYSQPPGGGIAVAGNYVYVVDSANNRIERFNLEGGEAMQWGSHGSGPGQFAYPRGVAANEEEVIVSDPDNHRLERFSPDGAYEGSVGEAGDGPGQFGYPYGVALDAADDVYVADDSNDRVVKLGPQLQFLGAWGGHGSKPGQLIFPRGLASDPAGDTYVADTANDRIEVFDSSGDYLRTIGTSALGPGELTAPRGLATDPTGRLLVSDTDGNRIETFAPGSDAYQESWSTAGGVAANFNEPAGIAIDPRGSVYVADPGNARLVRLWGEGDYQSEIGGPAQLGGAELDGADSVAVAAASDTTYVADSAHNRILVYSSAGALLARWGTGAGDGAAGSGAGEFDDPEAVAVNGAGDVYVADTGNDRIVELSPAGAVLDTWGSAGTADARFHSPDGVAVDGAGRVYVLDGENNRVQVFGGDGEFLAKWGTRGVGVGEFSQPGAIAVDCAGDVYVADTNNNRVERFNPVTPAGSGCLAPGSWPPPLDVAPVVHVSLPSTSGILGRGALPLSVSCERSCKFLISATLAPLGRGPAARLVGTFGSIAGARAAKLRLLVGTRARTRLRKELGRRKTLSAHVKIVAAGPTGRRTVITETYTVGR